MVGNKLNNKYMKYKIVIKKCKEVGYTLYVPTLRGCISEGKTIAEALENIKDAINDYLSVLGEIIKDKNYIRLKFNGNI